jgi:hypothetical protein
VFEAGSYVRGQADPGSQWATGRRLSPRTNDQKAGSRRGHAAHRRTRNITRSLRVLEVLDE